MKFLLTASALSVLSSEAMATSPIAKAAEALTIQDAALLLLLAGAIAARQLRRRHTELGASRNVSGNGVLDH